MANENSGRISSVGVYQCSVIISRFLYTHNRRTAKKGEKRNDNEKVIKCQTPAKIKQRAHFVLSELFGLFSVIITLVLYLFYDSTGGP